MTTESIQSESAPEVSAGTSTESTSADVTSQAKTADTAANAVEKAAENAVKTATQAPSPTPGQDPTKPAFTPNFKYKAALQEKEIEEFWRPLIKDPESEKKVKELFTRAEAFEYMKEKSVKTTQEFESLKGDYMNLASDANRVLQARDKGDLNSVFRQLQIDPSHVLKWAHQYLNMTDDQRAAEDLQYQKQLETEQYQTQLQTMQQQMYEQAVQARAMQLDVSLMRPDVANAAVAWDQRMGQSGAFRALVIEEGQKAHFGEGKDITPDEAITRVMQRFGPLLGGQQPQVVAQQTPQAGGVPPQAKPVIPTVQGRGTSPVRKQIKSLDDIKKLAKEM